MMSKQCGWKWDHQWVGAAGTGGSWYFGRGGELDPREAQSPEAKGRTWTSEEGVITYGTCSWKIEQVRAKWGLCLC